MSRLRTTLLAATLLAGVGGVAVAQMETGAATPSAPTSAATQSAPARASTYDPQQLPATKGRVAQYSLTPRGDVDGLILDDGTEVHMPPHLGAQLAALVKPGDAVTVHGLKARALPLVQAMEVTNDASGQSVTDAGPPPGGPHHGKHGGPHGPEGAAGQSMEAQGKIKQDLYGPRGDLNGVLLDDGTQIHMPPPEAQRLAVQLAPGQTIYAKGMGMAGPLGKVIGAQAIGPSSTQVSQIAAPPPHGGPGHDRHGPPPPPPAAPPQQ